MGFNIEELNAQLGESFMALGEHEGEHYGLPTNINLKSMVWYPKAAFDAAGYEVPEDVGRPIALSDQIVDDGSTPWCVGFGSEGSTGWPATDWMEDIMSAPRGPTSTTSGGARDPVQRPGRADRWPRRLARSCSPRTTCSAVPSATPTSFPDAPTPMFEDPPNCWPHRQASFINAEFPEGTVAGEDYDWFPLPPIDQEGTLYAA